MSPDPDNITISRSRYETLIVTAITGWALFLFTFGLLLGGSK